MPLTILVATPHSAFGELIRLSLEDTGLYRIRLAQTLREAQAAAALSVLNLTILDSDLPENGAAQLAAELRKRQPNLPLVLIPPENDPAKALIPADGYLTLPFFAPDLVEMAARLVTPVDADPSPVPAPAADPPAPAPTLAHINASGAFNAQFNRALKGTTALAGFILRGKQVEVSSSGLPPDAIREAAGIISANQKFDEGCDLVRFAHLDAAAGDYLVYATLLAGDLVLGMIYDPFAPLTRIHYQAAVLSRSLSTPPPSAEPPIENKPAGFTAESGAFTLNDLTAIETEAENFAPASAIDPDWRPAAVITAPEPKTVPGAGLNAENACVMVLLPADGRVTLSDPLAQVLASALPALCRDNRWQPGALAVRSNHVLVALRLPPGVEPGAALQVVRARLSEQVFAALPEMRSLDLLDNFWLPKALIVPGSAIPSSDAIQKFITSARQGQSTPANA